MGGIGPRGGLHQGGSPYSTEIMCEAVSTRVNECMGENSDKKNNNLVKINCER